MWGTFNVAPYGPVSFSHASLWQCSFLQLGEVSTLFHWWLCVVAAECGQVCGIAVILLQRGDVFWLLPVLVLLFQLSVLHSAGCHVVSLKLKHLSLLFLAD